MAVVVEQTIPFSPQSLDLDNPGRWNKLLPLIRPSVKRVQLSGGQIALVDSAHLDKNEVLIAAISNAGNFSSKLLSDRAVAVVISEQRGKAKVTVGDIAKALVQTPHGLVVIREGQHRRINAVGRGVIEVEVNGDLEYDHLLHILGAVTPETR